MHHESYDTIIATVSVQLICDKFVLHGAVAGNLWLVQFGGPPNCTSHKFPRPNLY